MADATLASMATRWVGQRLSFPAPLHFFQNCDYTLVLFFLLITRRGFLAKVRGTCLIRGWPLLKPLGEFHTGNGLSFLEWRSRIFSWEKVTWYLLLLRDILNSSLIGCVQVSRGWLEKGRIPTPRLGPFTKPRDALEGRELLKLGLLS